MFPFFLLFSQAMRFVYLFFFKILGWKIEGDVPRNLTKYIIAVAPHTSNWDFLVGLAVRSIMRFKSNFLGKKELFKKPWGWLFTRLGGYPVDRSSKTNKVDQVVQVIKDSDRFVIAIAPEGTRKKVEKWKTGFYYMAFQSGIPIVFTSIDYENRRVKFNAPFTPTGNLEHDAPQMAAYFKNIKGRNRSAGPVI